jgi:hypothetical protein
MALTITAVPIASLYAVRLTASGQTGTVSWYRDTADENDAHIGDGPALVDRGGPVSEPVAYYATNDLTLATAPTITVDSGGLPVLASTMYNVAYPVTVVSYRPYRGQGASVWHPVIGRSDPLVSIFPALYPAGMLRLRVETNDQRLDLVRNLLAKGDPLYLRPTCHDRLDEMTFLMLDWSDPYVGAESQGGPLYLDINYQRVTEVPPAWTPTPDRTYQTIIDQHATYQDVLDSYATYQDMLDGVPA